VEAGVSRQWHVARKMNSDVIIAIAVFALGFAILFAFLYFAGQQMLR
jgi:hypothetical protein